MQSLVFLRETGVLLLLLRLRSHLFHGQPQQLKAVELDRIAVAEAARLAEEARIAEEARVAAEAAAAEAAAAAPSIATASAGGVQMVVGRVTSGFGARWGSQHRGLDIAAPIGTPIRVPMDGTVVDSGPASGFGQWVRVEHADGTVTELGSKPGPNM